MTRGALTVTGLVGGDLEIGYVEARGERDGPRVTVLAGVHGTEYTSIAAARRLAGTLERDVVAGRVTVVPLVNPTAFWSRTPFVVPADGKNLNRSFPGDPAGTDAEVLAARLVEAFVVGADALLDLHAGDLPEALEPFALYEESAVQETSRALALAYGLGHVVRQPAAARTVGGSTCAAAADLGVAAVVAESGQNGILDPVAVDRHTAGLTNALRHLGVLAGEAVPGAELAGGPAVEHEGWHWLRTPVAGWWEAAVSAGVGVGEGELLGTVSDLLGGVRHEVRAPEAGVPLFVTTSPAVLADGLLLGLARGR